MSNKFGVYICKGCGIGESIDCDQLVNVASENTLLLLFMIACAVQMVLQRSKKVWPKASTSFPSWVAPNV